MHGAAKVRWALFPPKAQHQHSGCQLRLGVCSEDHAGVFGAGVAMIDILLDKISMNKAHAINPFLCAKTDKLMALIAEVPRNLPTDDLRDWYATLP